MNPLKGTEMKLLALVALLIVSTSLSISAANFWHPEHTYLVCRDGDAPARIELDQSGRLHFESQGTLKVTTDVTDALLSESPHLLNGRTIVSNQGRGASLRFNIDGATADGARTLTLHVISTNGRVQKLKACQLASL